MLRLYPLDGRMMDSKDALHSHLYMQFSLPAYYGRNLDALWDCLTEKEPGCILIQRADAAEKSLLLPLLGLFLDLVRETPGWSVRLSTGSPDCHENDDAPHSGSACKGDCAACQTSCAQSQVPAVPVGTPEERRPLSFVVFDFDGVLADSEPLHRMTRRELEHELLGDRKVAIASSRLRGGSTRLVYKMVLDAYGAAGDVEELYAEHFRRTAAKVLEFFPTPSDDLLRLLDGLDARGIGYGVCSSSPKSYLDTILSAYGLLSRFRFVVSCDEVSQVKPSPDLYLLAAKRVNVPFSEIAAIEDSRNGVASALAAGIRCFGYLPRPSSQDLSEAEGPLHRLSDLLKYLPD